MLNSNSASTLDSYLLAHWRSCSRWRFGEASMSTQIVEPITPTGLRHTHSRRRNVLRVATLLILVALVAYSAASVYLATHITAERHLPNGTPADVGLVYEPIAFQSAEDGIPLRACKRITSGI